MLGDVMSLPALVSAISVYEDGDTLLDLLGLGEDVNAKETVATVSI